MNKKVILSALLMVTMVFAAEESAKVTFSRGKNIMIVNEKKSRIQTGTRIPLTATIVTAEKSQVSLLVNGMQLRVGAGQTVKLSDVMGGNQAAMQRDSSFLSNMMRQPPGTPGKVAPTKVAGIRGKSEGNVPEGKGETAATATGPNYDVEYSLIIQKRHDEVLQKFPRPKTAEEAYLCGMAWIGKGNLSKGINFYIQARRFAAKDDLRIKIETAAAAAFMNDGNYGRALTHLRWLEKNLKAESLTAEVYYLMHQNLIFTAEDDKAKIYADLLRQKFPGHQLTAALAGN